MQLVVARAETPESRIRRYDDGTVITDLIESTAENPTMPDASLKEHSPGRVIKPHYHAVDQFQVFTAGTGTLGKHELAPYDVHFTHAHTPYGPLRAGDEAGYSFITLRRHYDPGQQTMPDSRDKLHAISPRDPFYITHRVSLETAASGLVDVPEIAGENGLFVKTLVLGPGEEIVAPDPAVGDGQYIVVLEGSVVDATTEREALTIMFTTPDEPAFHVKAGANGARALVFNFPDRRASGS